MGSYRMCVCFTRKFKVTEAEPPSEVKEAFRKYTAGNGGGQMTAEQLREFIVEVQGEVGATVADAELIVEQVLHRRHHLAKFKKRNSLTLDDFYHYLFSADLNAPIGSQGKQDMTAPLSHYYIYTGHNSYLTGNQLSSDCSDVPIIKALKSGVRVVELDIWPSSTKDEVHVLHGRTLTTPVELLKCLKSIKEHAFSSSPYPVIITLEDHLTPKLQAQVAQMLTDTFGDMLFYPKSECLEEVPSPEELKYRIIISTKPPKEYLEANSFDNTRTSSKGGNDSDDDVWGEEPLDPIAENENEDNAKSDSEKSNHGDDSSFEKVECSQRRPPVYKKLIAIHSGKPKGGLKEALKVEMDKVRRLSLSEQALERAAVSHGTEVVRFTQKNFLRIYPKGTRFNSSNYKPMIGWMHGAQMVAFNMQGYGRYLWLMHGMFRANGGCGYVKKPDFLMSTGPNNEVFDPKAKLPVKKTLKVKVYLGDGWHLDFKQTHFDLYSPPDFYTRVSSASGFCSDFFYAFD
ncbi:hypothetical protein QQ045_017038 [Rhodiola kirilowii]